MSRKKWTIEHIEEDRKSSANGCFDGKEARALAEFKERCKDLITADSEDHYLKKWLIARNYDVDKAENMFRTSEAYKKEMKVDSLYQEYQPPEVLQKYLPGGFCGFDKEGSPVLVELYGRMDMKGILHSAKTVDIEKTKLLLGERVLRMLKEQTAKLGRYVNGMTIIIDMTGVGAWMLWGPGIQMYAHMGKVLQDNYPEIVKRTYIINAPRIFPMLWKMFRPLVTEETKRKICILGGDYQKELLKQIDAHQLPVFLGGTLTDPDGDPMCPSKICLGGTIPDRYYLTDLTRTENMMTTTVGRSQTRELEYQVSVPGSILRWEFKTDGYDIGFGVLLLEGTKKESKLAIERVNSHMIPEDGTYVCQQAGKYIVVFDNSYSWARSKTVWYNIDVIEPSDQFNVNDIDQVTHGGSWERVAEQSECTKL